MMYIFYLFFLELSRAQPKLQGRKKLGAGSSIICSTALQFHLFHTSSSSFWLLRFYSSYYYFSYFLCFLFFFLSCLFSAVARVPAFVLLNALSQSFNSGLPCLHSNSVPVSSNDTCTWIYNREANDRVFHVQTKTKYLENELRAGMRKSIFLEISLSLYSLIPPWREESCQ